MERTKGQETNYTPMISQYLEVKKQYQDIIIFYRLGDFYEMFFEDAEIASKELQIYLTQRACGNGKFAPMCGVPYHAYLSYAQKLLDRGYKVGICEQVEDPKLAKRLVKREVTQIITPGANLDLLSNENNFSASVSIYPSFAVIVSADVSTGELFCVNVDSNKETILEKLLSLNIKELVISTNFDASIILYIKQNSQICISYYNDSSSSIDYEPLFTYLKDNRQIETTCRLLNYLTFMEKRELHYFKPAINVMNKKKLSLDYHALANMELVKSLDNKSYGSLLWILNKTSTPMGFRFLKSQVIEPLASKDEINDRLDIVEYFVKDYLLREKLKEILSDSFDLERLIARMNYDSCNAHDLLQLKKSVEILPKIFSAIEKVGNNKITSLIKNIPNLDTLYDLLERSIDPNAPKTITEGEIFKVGYNKELDELIFMTNNSKKWISQFEEREKERTGIKNLRIAYNTVFGYFIEVSTGQLPLIKDEYGYIRKQTIKTGERFVTQELKEQEDRLLRANEERFALETRLFKELRKEVSKYTLDVQKASSILSELDFYLSLATVANENNYIRPTFNDKKIINVKSARHPIIEKANPDSIFVVNDYHFNSDDEILIISGPNMGGKSTYMKEFGLLVIMAQIGSFVPCEEADLPIFDSLFARIGASDNLIKGESTFMVEMKEVASALEKASDNSLFIFDEIGRGTATFDGMALAQAIIEYIASKLHTKTFFSTHYHEITKLSEKIKGVKNIHCDVVEENGGITFLYKMKDGSMNKSYGVNVAKLASIPNQIINRASELLLSLEKESIISSSQVKEIAKVEPEKNELVDDIKKIDPYNMSPLEALNFLIEMKKKVNK